jgi:outer membrane receptor protein involved in Fe transport
MRTLFSFFFGIGFAVLPLAVMAQPAATGSITGTVRNGNGTPIGGAAVTIEGAGVRTATAVDGTFAVTVPPGIYTVVVTESGFQTSSTVGVAVAAGSSTALTIALAQSSFSSLRIIGGTSTTAGGRLPINTTPSSVAVITSQSIVDQGVVQIEPLLNETPGVIATQNGYNGASQGVGWVIQIRGGLAYETESLIDGHPLSIGSTGVYNPILINPYVLQNIELVKGPGSMPTEINGAVNGTINYVTLEPTRTPQEHFFAGSDQWGGITTAAQLTGSMPGHVIDYAFAVATDGTTGALHNYEVPSSTTDFDYLGGTPYAINGQQIAVPGNGNNPSIFVGSSNPQFYGYPGEIKVSQPLWFCCSPMNTGFNQDTELAKIRINLSQQTALTLSYLGGRDQYDGNGASLQYFTGNGIQFFNFQPPAGYTGSVPVGSSAYFDDNAGLQQDNQSSTGLSQAELRTSLAGVTVLARYYASFENDQLYEPYTDTNKLQIWGGIPLCPVGLAVNGAGTCGPGDVAPTLTYFNGQTGVISGTGGDEAYELSRDHSRGYSLELDKPIGDNTFTLSYDRTNHDSNFFENVPIAAIDAYQLAPGTSQEFDTIRGEAQIGISPKVNLQIADYLISYTSHYSGDGGVTFNSSSHNFNAPRLALIDRLNVDTSLRFSTGGSIAPPFMTLLSASGGAPVPNIPAAPNFYTQNVNNGNIAPETAWGYDIGIDKRLSRRVTFTFDAYLTDLRDQFLSSTYQDGTYTATSGAAVGITEPLFITETANLGHARYEGLEAQVVDDPIEGLGYRLQGSLIRAYPYDVSTSLYGTGPFAYSTNLAVIPNVNYMQCLISCNGVGFSGESRVPYSIGYAELNYKKGKWFGLVGVQYYGNNNQFNVPAFETLTVSLRYQVSRGGSLQFSATNLTNAYAQPYYDFFGGVPIPLVSGTKANPNEGNQGNFGITAEGNIGPPVLRLLYSQSVGGR